MIKQDKNSLRIGVVNKKIQDDANYKYVAAWEYKGGDINAEVLHKEELVYENIEVKTRSYK